MEEEKKLEAERTAKIEEEKRLAAELTAKAEEEKRLAAERIAKAEEERIKKEEEAEKNREYQRKEKARKEQEAAYEEKRRKEAEKAAAAEEKRKEDLFFYCVSAIRMDLLGNYYLLSHPEGFSQGGSVTISVSLIPFVFPVVEIGAHSECRSALSYTNNLGLEEANNIFLCFGGGIMIPVKEYIKPFVTFGVNEFGENKTNTPFIYSVSAGCDYLFNKAALPLGMSVEAGITRNHLENKTSFRLKIGTGIIGNVGHNRG